MFNATKYLNNSPLFSNYGAAVFSLFLAPLYLMSEPFPSDVHLFTCLVILAALAVAVASTPFEIHRFWWWFYIVTTPFVMFIRSAKQEGYSQPLWIYYSQELLLYSCYMALVLLVRMAVWKFVKPAFKLDAVQKSGSTGKMLERE